jgi:very-short-patch-repair endonuclease
MEEGHRQIPLSRKGRWGEHEENVMAHRPIPATSKSRAREMRAEPTDAERRLWRALRDRGMQALEFRRQVPIGAYVVDFVCFEHRLIVECDGFQHADNPRDARRDDWLRAQGFTVVRFWNHQILHEQENVLNTIVARCGLP